AKMAQAFGQIKAAQTTAKGAVLSTGVLGGGLLYYQMYLNDQKKTIDDQKKELEKTKLELEQREKVVLEQAAETFANRAFVADLANENIKLQKRIEINPLTEIERCALLESQASGRSYSNEEIAAKLAQMREQSDRH